MLSYSQLIDGGTLYKTKVRYLGLIRVCSCCEDFLYKVATTTFLYRSTIYLSMLKCNIGLAKQREDALWEIKKHKSRHIYVNPIINHGCWQSDVTYRL